MEDKRDILEKCIEAFGILDGITVAVSQRLDLDIVESQRRMNNEKK